MGEGIRGNHYSAGSPVLKGISAYTHAHKHIRISGTKRKGGYTMTEKEKKPAQIDNTKTDTQPTDKNTAPINVMDLEDIAIRLEMNVKRAKLLMDELTVDYLGKPDMSPQHPGSWKLFAGYDEYSTKAYIVFDYLLNLKEISKELKAMSNAVSGEVKRLNAV